MYSISLSIRQSFTLLILCKGPPNLYIIENRTEPRLEEGEAIVALVALIQDNHHHHH